MLVHLNVQLNNNVLSLGNTTKDNTSRQHTRREWRETVTPLMTQTHKMAG